MRQVQEFCVNGINAPESGQAFGTKSKEHLSANVAGQSVIVDYDKQDRSGRIIGKVILSDLDIHLEQIKAGMAWHYKKYQKEQSQADCKLYSTVEYTARKARLGLWQDPHPDPPREFRKLKRK